MMSPRSSGKLHNFKDSNLFNVLLISQDSSTKALDT
jgi:hypothetical protein